MGKINAAGLHNIQRVSTCMVRCIRITTHGKIRNV